jgi:hypothetical protein
LINVAISRAKDYLVIVCPDDDTKEIRNLVKIHKASAGSIEDILSGELNIDLKDITVHSKNIEKEIFGRVDFIQQESRVNKHQLVNVYNTAQRTYNVRESTTAIDIQIKAYGGQTDLPI